MLFHTFGLSCQEKQEINTKRLSCQEIKEEYTQYRSSNAVVVLLLTGITDKVWQLVTKCICEQCSVVGQSCSFRIPGCKRTFCWFSSNVFGKCSSLLTPQSCCASWKWKALCVHLKIQCDLITVLDVSKTKQCAQLCLQRESLAYARFHFPGTNWSSVLLCFERKIPWDILSRF